MPPAFPPPAWDEPALAAVLRQPGAFALIDPDGGFVLARVAADEAEVLTLGVAPKLRRQGERGRCCATPCATRRRLGRAAMFLEVAADNPAALALYAAEGFRVVGRRPGYYPDGADALVLRGGLDAARCAGHGAPP